MQNLIFLDYFTQKRQIITQKIRSTLIFDKSSLFFLDFDFDIFTDVRFKSYFGKILEYPLIAAFV